jgi:hypothetical protein
VVWRYGTDTGSLYLGEPAPPAAEDRFAPLWPRLQTSRVIDSQGQNLAAVGAKVPSWATEDEPFRPGRGSCAGSLRKGLKLAGHEAARDRLVQPADDPISHDYARSARRVVSRPVISPSQWSALVFITTYTHRPFLDALAAVDSDGGSAGRSRAEEADR